MIYSYAVAIFRLFHLVYAGGVNRLVLLVCELVISASAQQPSAPSPRFEDYPVVETFKVGPVLPVLRTPDERKFRVVITQGASKGWGVFDGTTGEEERKPGPNFAGHYILIHFGCGSPGLTECLMAAIVDAKTGRAYPPPPFGWRMPYFGVFSETPTHHPPFSLHQTQLQSPFEYRLNSRLLVAHICEAMSVTTGSVQIPEPRGCGSHFYVMAKNGLSLIGGSVKDVR